MRHQLGFLFVINVSTLGRKRGLCLRWKSSCHVLQDDSTGISWRFTRFYGYLVE